MAGGGLLLFLFLFVALFLVAAAFTLRQKRWAYVLGAAVAIVLLILFSSFILASLSNPADSGFWLAVSVLPLLLLAVVFGLVIHEREGGPQPEAVPRDPDVLGRFAHRCGHWLRRRGPCRRRDWRRGHPWRPRGGIGGCRDCVRSCHGGSVPADDLHRPSLRWGKGNLAQQGFDGTHGDRQVRPLRFGDLHDSAHVELYLHASKELPVLLHPPSQYGRDDYRRAVKRSAAPT